MGQRLPVLFILVTLTLDAIGFGLILPVMPDLLREVSGGDLSQAALWAGVLIGGFALMQFLCGPVVGGLSDRFGRKPVLLVSLAVLAADYVILALAGSIWLVLAARLLTGAASATQVTAVAYLADISTPEEKAQRFGLLGAAFGAGFVLGPAIGGMLAEFGTRAPFVAAACLAGANMVFGALVMRETLSPGNRRPFSLRRANPFAAFVHFGRMAQNRRLLAIYFLHEFGFFVYPVIWAYFAIARFGWSPGQVGFSLALFGVGFAVVQAGLIRPVLRALGRQGAMVAGTLAGIVSFAGLTVVTTGGAALMLIPVAAMGGFVVPALRAELSDRVGADRQGELQGLMSSMRAVGMMAAPLVFTWTFAAFTGAGAVMDLPGAAFGIAALLNLAALALLLRRR